MKKFFLIVLLLNCLIVIGQNNKLNIVPAPVQVEMDKGFSVLQSPILFSMSNTYGSEPFGLDGYELFKEYIKYTYGIKLVEEKGPPSMSGTEIGLYGAYKGKPDGYYELEIRDNQIHITGTALGEFYAYQTLMQMVKMNAKKQLVIPNCTIIDYPRFPYRGMHLDVCRHFFPVSFIKKYIDYLATYKYNTFHWHLTEDQGWRIEIKKYPELTSIGSKRNGTLIGRYPGKGNDNKPYGGFYTQEEIKEVVQYAKDRYIEVIPEIEMPGHGSAAIAAYPWLSCFPQKPTEIPAKMISQKSIEEQKNGRIKLVQETWGVFDDIFCAGKDSTFKFLENVIDEVVTLFPSKYFHMGGDEAPKAHWKKCPACQKRMKDNNLKDEHELQSWFVRRIEKYVNSKGKILIGWDEILEGGLAPNAVVMSWRGEKGGIEAAKQKHNVIMTPGNPLYFDHTQSNNEDSVTFGGYNPIEKVYAYEPVSKELTAAEGKYILGAQANMWAEYQNNTRKLEYQMFPRMIALSEVLWSPKEKRDWKDFERRLPVIFERLDKQGINYSKAYFDLKATVLPTDNYDGVLWKAETKNKNVKIKWVPSYFSSFRRDYIKPLFINETTDRMSIVLLSGDDKLLSSVMQSFYFNKATGKKITLVTPASQKYPADGPFTLVNGVRNEKGMLKSSEFLGFNGTDLEAIIDLGKPEEIRLVRLYVLEQQGSWIYAPKSLEVYSSDDGTNFRMIENADVRKQAETTRSLDWGFPPLKTRYVKVVAKNFGNIPAGKPGAGNPAWLFADEIEVQ